MNELAADYSVPQLERLISGLELFYNYDPRPYVQAEHNEIFCGVSEGAIVSDADEQRLAVLGWSKDERPHVYVFNCQESHDERVSDSGGRGISR